MVCFFGMLFSKRLRQPFGETQGKQTLKQPLRLTLRLGLTGAQTLHPRRNPRKFFLQGERGEGDFQFAKFC